MTKHAISCKATKTCKAPVCGPQSMLWLPWIREQEKNDITPQLEKHFCRVVIPKLRGKTRLHELARFDPSSDPWCWSFDGIEHSGNDLFHYFSRFLLQQVKKETYGQLQSSKNNCFSMPKRPLEHFDLPQSCCFVQVSSSEGTIHVQCIYILNFVQKNSTMHQPFQV